MFHHLAGAQSPYLHVHIRVGVRVQRCVIVKGDSKMIYIYILCIVNC